MIGIVCAFFHTEGKGFYSSRQLRLYSRGSADPRESLRRRRISKLALSAHKVLPDQEARSLPRPFLRHYPSTPGNSQPSYTYS